MIRGVLGASTDQAAVSLPRLCQRRSRTVERGSPSRSRAKAMSCANRSVLRGRSRMQSRYSGGFGLNTRDRLPGLRAAGSLGAQRSVWFVCFSVHPNSSPHSSRASNNNLNYSVTHVFCHHNHCNGFDSISHFLASRKRQTMNPVGSGRSYT